MIRITAIFNFPSPTTVRLFQLIARQEDIDLQVLFCKKPLNETSDGYFYSRKNIRSEWNVPLLTGYKYHFLEDPFDFNPSNVLGIINPEIKQYIFSNEMDILLIGTSFWSWTTWAAINVAKKKGIALITKCTIETEKKRNLILDIIRRNVVKKYFKNMTAGIFETEGQKKFMISHGLKEKSVFWAPSAVSNEFFDDRIKELNRDEIRSELGLKKEDTVFVFLANIIERKRPKDLLLAYERLRKERKNICLFYIGDGDLRNRLEEYVAKMAIERVCFLGFLNHHEMCKYLMASDVFVLPSENDASPKSLNEAMNFSLPIVITDGVGSASELLEEGVNGFIYHRGDIDELVNILSKMVDNSDMRREMGIESKRLVEKNGIDKAIDGWREAAKYCLDLR